MSFLWNSNHFKYCNKPTQNTKRAPDKHIIEKINRVGFGVINNIIDDYKCTLAKFSPTLNTEFPLHHLSQDKLIVDKNLIATVRKLLGSKEVYMYRGSYINTPSEFSLESFDLNNNQSTDFILCCIPLSKKNNVYSVKASNEYEFKSLSPGCVLFTKLRSDLRLRGDYIICMYTKKPPFRLVNDWVVYKTVSCEYIDNKYWGKYLSYLDVDQCNVLKLPLKNNWTMDVYQSGLQQIDWLESV